MMAALDPCVPDDCTSMDKWTQWTRLIKRILQTSYVRGVCFEEGTKTYDAVFFNPATNSWWRSQATKNGEDPKDNTRLKVHGVARPDLGAVQVQGYVDGCYQFPIRENVYVGSSTPGILTSTKTDLIAGYSFKVNGFLLTGWLTLAADVIANDPSFIEEIINNFFTSMTEEQYEEFINNFFSAMTEEQYNELITNIFNNADFAEKFEEFINNYFESEAGQNQ